MNIHRQNSLSYDSPGLTEIPKVTPGQNPNAIPTAAAMGSDEIR